MGSWFWLGVADGRRVPAVGRDGTGVAGGRRSHQEDRVTWRVGSRGYASTTARDAVEMAPMQPVCVDADGHFLRDCLHVRFACLSDGTHTGARTTGVYSALA